MCVCVYAQDSAGILLEGSVGPGGLLKNPLTGGPMSKHHYIRRYLYMVRSIP